MGTALQRDQNPLRILGPAGLMSGNPCAGRHCRGLLARRPAAQDRHADGLCTAGVRSRRGALSRRQRHHRRAQHLCGRQLGALHRLRCRHDDSAQHRKRRLHPRFRAQVRPSGTEWCWNFSGKVRRCLLPKGSGSGSTSPEWRAATARCRRAPRQGRPWRTTMPRPNRAPTAIS